MTENVKIGQCASTKNGFKEEGSSHPDVWGEFTLKMPEDAKAGDLIKYKIAGWDNVGKDSGNPYINLRISEKIPNNAEEGNNTAKKTLI